MFSSLEGTKQPVCQTLQITYFFFSKILLIVMDILPACRPVQYRCAVPLEARRGHWIPWNLSYCGCELPCGAGYPNQTFRKQCSSVLLVGYLVRERERQWEGGRQRRRENMKLEEVCDPRVQKDLLKRKRWREKHDQHILLVSLCGSSKNRRLREPAWG